MFENEMVSNVVGQIIESIHIVQKRTKNIQSADDFSSTEQGMLILDSVCMKLAAIGESIKNLDKITNKQLLSKYTEIDWRQAMGMRDIIVHHYFDIDAEVIFKTLNEDIPPLLGVLERMHSTLKQD
ncbi:HepT-like ribonuclease domain-containing protein [Marinilabilia salmonicolor]|uniref:HepT-like ribonuclease domain-containing protein n=1 Tax=Marinilabilia salmonicolor TaxID=989 RepID=UPI000299F608|nr:HepT-like ribonuclease domain-containing protein [Marinilabilia salmonicolor]